MSPHASAPPVAPRTTPAAADRAALAAELEAMGPDAPTLCEGWTTRHLAAHVVLRETRPDATPGMTSPDLPLLSAHTDRLMDEAIQRPYEDVVDDLRNGPPALSAFALPGADALLNTSEMFVHLEDVRRAQPDWAPRELDARHRRALWGAALALSRRALRKCPVGVVLVVPDGPRSKVHRGTPAVTLTGPSPELLLYVMGRRDHSLVEVGGPDDAVERFQAWLAPSDL